MRTYLTSDKIAAVWVAQSQETGRCSSRMSFSGREFYSYGTVIAEVLTHHGKTVFLVNSSHYSGSTSRHVNGVRCAIPKGALVFEVPGIRVNDHRGFSNFARILEGWQAGASYFLEESAKAREPKRTRLILEAHAATVTMRKFAACFGLTLTPYVAIPLSDAAIRKTIRERKAQEKTARREREERAQSAQSLRAHFPKQTITTREVYKNWKQFRRASLKNTSTIDVVVSQ